MIPICLVTGFLGAGKTTLLRRLKSRFSERRLVYLVNEYSPTDVDGRMLALAEDQLVSVAGGSIFSRCKVMDFIIALEKIESLAGGNGAIEGVVIEASGMADPRVMRSMLSETGLDRVFRLAQVVTVIDPSSFLKLMHTLPNITGQVEAADLALINKADAHDAATVTQAREAVLRINPRAAIVETVQCAFEFEPFAGEARGYAGGTIAPCKDPDYTTVSARVVHRVDWPRLREGIEAAGEAILRVKGFVNTAGGWRFVEWSASGWEERAAGAERGDAEHLMLIAQKGSGAAAHALARQIERGEFGQ